METYDIFETLADAIGYGELAECIYGWFGAWKMEECLRDIASDYEIHLDDDEDEDED